MITATLMFLFALLFVLILVCLFKFAWYVFCVTIWFLPAIIIICVIAALL